MHSHMLRRQIDAEKRSVRFTLDCAIDGAQSHVWTLDRSDAGSLRRVECGCGDVLYYFLSATHFEKEGECRIKAFDRGHVHAALFGSHDRCRCGVRYDAADRIFHTGALDAQNAAHYACGICVFEKPEVYRTATELTFVMRTQEGDVWRCVKGGTRE